MSKQTIKPEILRLRINETYKQLGFFLLDKRTPEGARRFFGRMTCLSLLYRIVGEQNYDANIKTVGFVIKHYAEHRWHGWEMALWLFSHKTIYRKTPDELERLLVGEVEHEDDWPTEITV